MHNSFPHPSVFLRVDRVASEVCRQAQAVTVADLHECMETLGFAGLMTERMQCRTPGTSCVGPAVTAYCRAGDNLMAHRALSLALPGDVVVFVCEDERSASMWGDVATHYALKKGLAGAVIQACARDIDTVRRLGFPLWSTVVRPIHCDKLELGCVNMPVRCDGVTVCPGDLVAADGDGVVVVPRRHAAHVVGAATQRMRREETAIASIKNGASPWSLNVQAVYAAMNVPEVDAAWNDARPSAPEPGSGHAA